ncbi:pyridoxal kinase [Pseudovibrio sp. Tun.PSC04-5.I4]|uniref:pyridoxal kinase n=1 Tax=Pseudovibrio sp. Tun.PSC04-5.I4 TaxID=1798213 RepID=UPI00087E79B1|nr:pyridoxal kinase [Pseudovibrio sp. Tun.PSC04-5.I4]SDR28727.1 pyridoxine kinase [Pseudovibrio sp. Tun.PSC04-5.I4]
MSLERFVKKVEHKIRENAPKPKPSVLVVSSQVVSGCVGTRGAVFALERMGFNVWMLPTILLPWHPGQGAGVRISPSEVEFRSLVEQICANEDLSDVKAVISGYMANPAQVSEVAKLVKEVKSRNSDAVYLCDPVIGDKGDLYVREPIAEAIRDELLPLADIITPNRFELAWLSGFGTEMENEAVAAARTLGVERTIVTSSPAMRRNSICNLLVGPNGSLAIEHAEVQGAPNGTGDLIAALYLARSLSGQSDEEALKKATASTFELVARSVKVGSDNLLYSEHQDPLIHPMALVNSRHVVEAPERA